MKILQQQKKTSGSPIKCSPKKRHPSSTIHQQATVPPAKRPKILLVDESPPSEQKKQPANLPWVDKYKPTSLKQLVGQQTDKSSANKLLDWLRNWARNNLAPPPSGGEKKKARPNPFAAQSDGSFFKAALLSGPPGIGKTTAAVMCCRELGLAFVEMNASDARNKSSIEKHSEQLTSNQIEKYFKEPSKSDGTDENSLASISATAKPTKKSPSKGGAKMAAAAPSGHRQIDHVLIMDEVDGMSGNADRAGMAELVQMIKRTRTPIICICNDRQSRKIRSLANYCFDLRFARPRAEQIKGRLLSIVAKERLTIAKDMLDRVIEASNQDIRQCINTLQLMAGGGKGEGGGGTIARKIITLNIFEAARQILSVETPFLTKFDLYFSDYSMMPMFVQENYPIVRASKMNNLDHLCAMRQAADSIAFGDIVSRQIRSSGHWNLMNEHAMFSCALPATIMDGHIGGQIQFPAWFGKYSNAQKRQRLMRQLALHSHLKISGNNQALVQDYLPLLRERLYRPLIKLDTGGVKNVLAVYNHYSLLKEDTEAINELGVWPASLKGGGTKQRGDLAAQVSTKAKSALTRQLNKEKRLLPFAQPTQVKMGRRKAGGKGGGGKASEDRGGGGEEDEEGKGEEEAADDLEGAEEEDMDEMKMMEF